MKKTVSFEEAMTQLEESVRLLESGKMSLDESLKEYERAVGLVKICNDRLENAKRRVQLLVENDAGEVSDVRFDVKDNEN